MGIDLAKQTSAFLWSVLFGAFLGLFYDFFRILRIAVRTLPIIVFFQDVIFWFLSGLSTFIFIFTVNSGELRLFLFLGILTGSAAYYFTLGMLVMAFAKTIISFIKYIAGMIFTVILLPFSLLNRIFTPFLKKIGKKVKVFFIYPFKYLFKKVKIVYNTTIKRKRRDGL